MSKFLMVLRVAVASLVSNKLRSFLTMLGIIIGVAAVIALVAIGQGAQSQIVSQFQSLGSNLLTVTSASSFGFSRDGVRESSRQLNNADAKAIRGLATSVNLVAPEYGSQGTIVYGGKTTSAGVTGVTSEYPDVRNWTVSLGRFITPEDEENLANVVVLGQTVVQELFGSGNVNPLGETVRINRQNYTVVGMLKAKGTGGNSNQDNVVFMPLRTAQLKLGGAGTTELRAINLQVKTAKEMDLAQAQVTAILRSLHGLESGAEDDFMVQNQADILDTVQQATGIFTTLLGSIAAISLLVGGIGIMNIMLVSVTERTREVGLRKAVGAKRRDILIQFLTEAMVISVLGGILGVLLGFGLAQAITPLLGGTRAMVTFESVALALAVSLGIGIFFGLYPANRAAGLNPIDALRYE
jgi:putative ABC transport system permease protein